MDRHALKPEARDSEVCDIEVGVRQVGPLSFVRILSEILVIDPLSWSDEAQVAAQMRMSLWGQDGAVATKAEETKDGSLLETAIFVWPDRGRTLVLAGERRHLGQGCEWTLQRIVCAIARPSKQGSFVLRLAVDMPTYQLERLFDECLKCCGGAGTPLACDDSLRTGPFYGIPDYRCEVRMRDGRIVAVVPASMARRVAYGTWSYVEDEEGPHVVLTCSDNVLQMTRMALLETAGSLDGLGATLRRHVGMVLDDIGINLRRWRAANDGVDAALEQQRQRVSECLARGSWVDGGSSGDIRTRPVAYDNDQLNLENLFEARAREKEERDKADSRMRRWRQFVGWGRISAEAARNLEKDLLRIVKTMDHNREFINVSVNEQYDRDRERYDSLKAELGLDDKYMPQIVLLCNTNDAAAQLIMTILTDRAARLWGASDKGSPENSPNPSPI